MPHVFRNTLEYLRRDEYIAYYDVNVVDYVSRGTLKKGASTER